MKEALVYVSLSFLPFVSSVACKAEKNKDDSAAFLLLQPASGPTSDGTTVTAQLRYINNTGSNRDFALNTSAGCSAGTFVSGTTKSLLNGAASTYVTVLSGPQGTGASLTGRYVATMDAIGNVLTCLATGTISTGANGRTYSATITGASVTLNEP